MRSLFQMNISEPQTVYIEKTFRIWMSIGNENRLVAWKMVQIPYTIQRKWFKKYNKKSMLKNLPTYFDYTNNKLKRFLLRYVSY